MTLIPAHQALEDLVLTKSEAIAKREVEAIWAKTVYDGLWFSPVRAALDAFVAKTQELVTGEVRVRLPACPPAAARAPRRSRAPASSRRTRRVLRAPARTRARRTRSSPRSPPRRASRSPRPSSARDPRAPDA